MSKINDLTSSLHNMILIFFEKFVFYFLSICLAFFFLHKINIIFSVIVIVWCLLVIMFVFLTNRKALNLSRQFSKFGGVITGKLVDGLSNVLAVKLFLGIKKEINILGDTLTKTEESERGLEKHYLFISSVISFSFLIIQIINFFLLIQGRKEGNISISDFVVVIGINFALYDILSNFSKNLSEFSKIVGKVMHAFEKLSVSSENNTLSDESATIKNGDISFEDVCFSYTRNISVFDRLSFSINSGEKIGIVGLSGIGKSTILHLLLKLFVVDKGKIFLNGKDLDKIKVEDIRNAISVIPQDPLLFHRTILENIRYSRPCASDQEVMDAAIKAGAHDFIMNLPYHYNTTIGEKGIKLSGGQRQRISIARGLLKKSCILVLDEATSQLDSIVENFIQNNIFDRMCDKTIIVIAHRLSTLEKMDKILLIDNGKLAGNGSHEELLQKNIVYKKLWESQIKSNK